MIDSSILSYSIAVYFTQFRTRACMPDDFQCSGIVLDSRALSFVLIISYSVRCIYLPWLGASEVFSCVSRSVHTFRILWLCADANLAQEFVHGAELVTLHNLSVWEMRTSSVLSLRFKTKNGSGKEASLTFISFTELGLRIVRTVISDKGPWRVLGHLCRWRWGCCVALKLQDPITQRRSVIYQNNWILLSYTAVETSKLNH